MVNLPSLETISYELSNLSQESVSKIHKAITSLLVICLAFFAARLFITGTSTLLGSLKSSISVPQQSQPLSDKKKASRMERADYDVIITRNIFNSKGEIPEEEAVDAGGVGTSMAKRTTLDIELVGTIVVNDPTRSIAAINLKRENKVEPFMVNDTVLSKAVVVSIARRKVLLKNTVSGDLEFVEIKEDENQLSQPMNDTPQAVGIKMIGDDHAIIARDELDRSLNNINELLVQARVIPNMEDGKVTGYKIFGIQPGSLYEKIGAKNGDVIKSVNGVEMTNPASAMNMYQQLRTGNKFEFNIVRDGVNKSMQIDIR